MKKKFAQLTILVSLTVGCAARYTGTTPGPGPYAEGAEAVVQELLVRSLAAGMSEGETGYVSFGDSWKDKVDPPPAFFRKISDLPVSLKPVSQLGEPPDPLAVLFVVHFVAWVQSDARVEVTRFRYGVGAADGYTAVTTWKDGSWRIAKTVDDWHT